MSADITVYRLKANPLAQFAGNPEAPVVAPTYAATITLDPNAGYAQLINGVATTSATCTINAASAGVQGQTLVLFIRDTGGITVTFGTYFKSQGTCNPTTGKTIAVHFVSDGTNWYEPAARATAE